MTPPGSSVAKLDLPVFAPDGGVSQKVNQGSGSEADPPTPADTNPAEAVGSEGEKQIGSFILGECLPPVPQKLVAKIQKGDYVEMAELLRDNMELQRRQADDSQNQIKANRREVPDLLSWITCFGTYASVVCSKHPHWIRELLAYQTILVREARRCGGKGWQAYDAMFHQQAAHNPKVDWSVLNSSLYSTSFLTQQNQRGRTCQWCLETDHLSVYCALAPINPPGKASRGTQREGYGEDRRPNRGRSEIRGACFAWNDGRCSLPYCRFKHVCAKCGLDSHRESQCGTTRVSLGSRQIDSEGMGAIAQKGSTKTM